MNEKMHTYIGTKIVFADPMTRQEYNDLRGWTLPENEDGTDPGYLVEYTDGGKANMAGFDGYVSWSPKEQFDNAYRETDGLTFGLAVEALKKGAKVSRLGWNGRGMYVYHVPANSYPATTDIAKAEFGGALVPYNAYLAIKNVDLSISTWVPSINDVLAEDWQVIG